MAKAVRDYSFQDRLVMPTGIPCEPEIATIIKGAFPAVTLVEKATITDDKAGTDLWAYRKALPPLSIDLKRRDLDPLVYFKPPKDDLVLELWSVLEKHKKGWTLDVTKRSDYILWFFIPTRRWVIVPFPPLCAVFNARWQEWMLTYQIETQSSNKGQWHSQCIMIPTKVIWQAIQEWMKGGNT